jgi:recombination protein RecA
MAKKTAVSDKLKPADSDKVKALGTALANIERQFGKGAVMKLGEASAHLAVEVISTGSITLDLALGVGGVPRGRVIEIYGPESSGKTTVALHIIAEAQKTGGIAAFIDAEHALDPVYAKALGVNVDELYISQPDNGEQALEICEALARSSAVDVIVIDSVAALVPRAELEGDMGDSHVGLHARLMSQALRKLTAAISKSHTCVVFINQIRSTIPTGYGYNSGPQETTTGGKALKFYASVRMDVRRAESIKQGSEVLGNRTKVRIVKNKVAPPFTVAEFEIIYGEGISRLGSIVDLAVENSIIQKSGSWYSYNEERLAQGRENVKALLEEKPELADEIEKTVRTVLLTEGVKTEISNDTDDDDDDLDDDFTVEEIGDE